MSDEALKRIESRIVGALRDEFRERHRRRGAVAMTRRRVEELRAFRSLQITADEAKQVLYALQVAVYEGAIRGRWSLDLASGTVERIGRLFPKGLVEELESARQSIAAYRGQ